MNNELWTMNFLLSLCSLWLKKSYPLHAARCPLSAYGGYRNKAGAPSPTSVPSLKNLIFLMLVHYISIYAYTYIVPAQLSNGKQNRRPPPRQRCARTSHPAKTIPCLNHSLLWTMNNKLWTKNSLWTLCPLWQNLFWISYFGNSNLFRT